jgi:hypothetical protein
MLLIFKHIIPTKYCGLAIYPFIFLKNKDLLINKSLINHERIHLKQQLELLWVFFFIWYFLEYLIGLFRYKNHSKAYINISFEQEAYMNETNLEYLKERKMYSFLKYFK